MTLFVEDAQIVAGFVPVDTQGGANTGDWVNMADYRKCTVLFYAAIGVAGDDATITVLQASDNGGTGSKALTFTTIFEKEGATALSAVGQWTKQTQAAANTYVSASGAENEQLIAIEVDASDLDVANGFDHVSASVADTGAAGAQLGCLLYVLRSPRYGNAGDSMVSAL